MCGFGVAHVNPRAAAEQVVQSAKFSPIGGRGMFGGRQSYGVTNYFQKANEETLLVVLIEEIEAIENLTEILSVDHIDVFFVAPSDLAQTMGHIGNHTHPEVQATIDRAIAQILAAGKVPGTLVDDDNVERYVKAGVRFLLTGWTSWVARGAREFQRKVTSAA